MDVYFNDWSCAGQGSLRSHINEINDFIALLKALADTRICTMVLDVKPSALTLCDFPLSQCHIPIDDCAEAGFRSLVLGIFNYFGRTELDTTHIFSKPAANDSVLLGNAQFHGCPSASICFDNLYASDKVYGLKNGRRAFVTNLYKPESIDVLAPKLYSRTQCATHKALEEPLWNTDATSKYMADLEERIKADIQSHPDEKIHILLKHATVIANLNGWIYHENVSKKNSNRGRIRHIFKAADLSGTAYLSVDLEKTNVYFELHDKRGHHRGEYKWDGTKSDDGDNKAYHDIDV